MPGNRKRGPVYGLYIEKLKDSGLTEKDGERYKFEVLGGDETRALAPNFLNQPCIRIPYFRDDGTVLDFYRIRYLGEFKGFMAGAKKPRRYTQASESFNDIYLPPLKGGMSWKVIKKDHTIPLIITEGELKAAKAAAVNRPVIGLGGVEMFRSKRQGYYEFLPALDEVEWKERDVAIIWDSDVGTKEGAIKAREFIARSLIARGSKVKMLTLPDLFAGTDKKTGLDDYLKYKSERDLDRLVAETPEVGASLSLWELNERFVLVKSTATIFDQDERLDYKVDDFKIVYGNIQHVNEAGKRVSSADSWLTWPQRTTATRYVYAPGQDTPWVGRSYNLWRGWGVESKRGDVSLWKELLDYLFQGAGEAAKRWGLQWFAYPVQNPGAKLNSSFVLWGTEQGTGKTFLGMILRDVYGKENCSVIDESHLNGSFNSWLAKKQMVVGEEITGEAAIEKKHAANRLKALITQEEVTINEKYKNLYTLPACANFFFTSNSCSSFVMEDTDRRYFVIEVKGPALSTKFYSALNKQRKSGALAPAVRYYLENTIDTSSFEPLGHAYRTAAKDEMNFLGKSDCGQWVADLKENLEQKVVGEFPFLVRCDIFTPAEIYQMYNPEERSHFASRTTLGRELRAAGFILANEGVPITLEPGKTQRFWILRNIEKWKKASKQEIVAHWRSFTGLQRSEELKTRQMREDPIHDIHKGKL